jgi:enoyl-CoA hydratase/carnithine racemase
LKSRQWSHFSLSVENEQLWRVTFDNPPINLVSPEMLVELPELIDLMKAGE